MLNQSSTLWHEGGNGIHHPDMLLRVSVGSLRYHVQAGEECEAQASTGMALRGADSPGDPGSVLAHVEVCSLLSVCGCDRFLHDESERQQVGGPCHHRAADL